MELKKDLLKKEKKTKKKRIKKYLNRYRNLKLIYNIKKWGVNNLPFFVFRSFKAGELTPVESLRKLRILLVNTNTFRWVLVDLSKSW